MEKDKESKPDSIRYSEKLCKEVKCDDSQVNRFKQLLEKKADPNCFVEEHDDFGCDKVYFGDEPLKNIKTAT